MLIIRVERIAVQVAMVAVPVRPESGFDRKYLVGRQLRKEIVVRVIKNVEADLDRCDDERAPEARSVGQGEGGPNAQDGGGGCCCS